MEYKINNNFIDKFILNSENLQKGTITLDEMILNLSKEACYTKDEFYISKKKLDVKDLKNIEHNLYGCARIKSEISKIYQLIKLKDKTEEQEKFFKDMEETCVGIKDLSCDILLKHSNQTPPTFKLVCQFDIDEKDDNNAVSKKVLYNLQQNLSVFTTITLLNQSLKFALSFRKGKDVLKLLADHSLYREKNGDLILLLPKNLKNIDKIGVNFNALEEVEYDVLNGFKSKKMFSCKAFMTSLLDIFIESECSKQIILMGHGKKGVIAGLKINKYRAILDAFNRKGMNCEGIRIVSCHGEGNISEHYVQNSKKEKIPPFFPIIVDSIIDGVHYSPDIKKVFKSFDTYKKLKSEGMDPLKAMGLSIATPEVASGSSQVIFPSQFRKKFERIPTENSPIYDIFHNTVKLHQENNKEIETQLPIIGIGVLSLHHPLKIHPPKKTVTHRVLKNNLKIIIRDSVLHSRIPGHGRHFIKEINLEKDTLFNLYHGTAQFHLGCSSNKAFFIKKMTDKYGEYSNLVIASIKGETILMYSCKDENGKTVYFNQEGRDKQVISKDIYERQLNKFLFYTMPDNEVIKLNTEGTESEESLTKDLKEFFIDDFTGESLIYYNFEQNFGFILQELKKDRSFIEHFSEEKQRIIAIELLKENPKNGNYLPSQLKNREIYYEVFKYRLSQEHNPENIEEVLFILGENGLLLPYVSSKLLEDTNIALDIIHTAVMQNGLALEFVPKKLITKDIAMMALSNNMGAFEFLSEELKEDVDIGNYGLKIYGSQAIKFLPLKYQKNIIMQMPSLIKDASESVKRDFTFLNEFLSLDGKNMAFLADELQKKIIMNNPQAIIYASKEILAEEDFIITFLSQDPSRLEFLPENLQKEIIDKNSNYLPYASSQVKELYNF